ncbi:MBL fold metallo-hydrolase [Paramagnetospirillum magneticum]|uniref:Metal-dependent hydrolase of the beta-lactamase superfamily I n=1 Tax=Paramagnetospirillum magneticum (strain ATCC 700264 / AMB-1) TaxID=342108 RepID=Q2W4T5_PARM1|nr:MBL fold metallo-hydrolase [Paramagnetospirillum magneticum]BAE51140.1 Metal-dependent hydrolase of the beta-lactamase superfamily I [Paramagnetospirillum magneticum AMB-1]
MVCTVKFWGVRGSIACPSPEHVVYGGNTSCIAVTTEAGIVVFDAGTGIRSLGREIIGHGLAHAHLFFTHTHWDHINGFPFFAPAYNPAFRLDIHGPKQDGSPRGIQHVLMGQMETPNFPVPLAAMRGIVSYEDFEVGSIFSPYDGVTLRTAPLRHPNGACGYRLETGGVVVAYITDTEHVPGTPDENVLFLMRGADLVIYDCTYTDDQFPTKIGWGHSTWQEGIRLARAAGAKRLAIFHHDPEHTDDIMAGIEAEAVRSWTGVVVARDGMEITL